MANKFIVVTGGTKGIGRAIAEKFSSQGFDVATCSRNAKELEGIKEELTKNNPDPSVLTFTADLSKKGEAKRFADEIASLDRTVDVLVNNAGRFLPGKLADEPDAVYEEMIHTNMSSAYYVTKGLVQRMMKRKQGHIFNICSVASLGAYPNGGSYAISKSALLGFSRCLREELKEHGVRVTAVLAGATYTDSWQASNLPASRFIKPEDVADSVFAAYSLSRGATVEEILIRPQQGDI